MARFSTLISRFGERQLNVVAEVDLTTAYTVPNGAELGVTDIKVMALAPACILEVLFWLNDTVSGHQWCAHFGTGASAGIYSCHWETPIPFAAGAVVSLTVLSPTDDALVAASWQGELLM